MARSIQYYRDICKEYLPLEGFNKVLDGDSHPWLTLEALFHMNSARTNLYILFNVYLVLYYFIDYFLFVFVQPWPLFIMVRCNLVPSYFVVLLFVYNPKLVGFLLCLQETHILNKRFLEINIVVSKSLLSPYFFSI